MTRTPRHRHITTHEWVEGVEHEYNGYDVVIKDSRARSFFDTLISSLIQR
ncbi:MAG: hypothetical protein U5K00_10435 [Melioribacteraceae bacterium]|nr:hypothetical protein [Melioribacteraceae bacterium]